ncbi:MAG: hypothetical protein WBN77_00135 [Desulfobacterales bacterium]
MKASWGIVVALASEAQQLFGRWCWRLEDRRLVRHVLVTAGLEIIIVRAGLGYQRAYSASRWLIAQGVAGLMVLGVSGGLDPGLKPGTLVVADKVFHLDCGRISDVWRAETSVCQQAQDRLNAQKLTARIGGVLTVPWLISSAENKRALFHQSCALTVDTESAAVAFASSQAHLPFFGMRVVCDPAKQAVSRKISDCLNPAGTIQILSLVSCLFQQPCLMAELFLLAKQYQTAITALRRGWQVLANQKYPFF